MISLRLAAYRLTVATARAIARTPSLRADIMEHSENDKLKRHLPFQEALKALAFSGSFKGTCLFRKLNLGHDVRHLPFQALKNRISTSFPARLT
jgi:hypothetical protein